MTRKAEHHAEIQEMSDNLDELRSVAILSASDIHGTGFPVDVNDARNDRLSIAVRSKESDIGIYDLVIEEVAEEAASLKRLRKQVGGGDVAASAIISEKRIVALKRISDLVAMRSKEFRDSAGGKVDFRSDSFQRVLEYLTSLIVEAAKEAGMQETTSQRFFLKLKQKFNGFEEMAEKLYAGEVASAQTRKMAENSASFHKGQRE